MAFPQGPHASEVSTVFEFQMNAPVLEGMVTAGRFLLSKRVDTNDEAASALMIAEAPPPAMSLACASSGQRVVIHNNNSAARVHTNHAADSGFAPHADLTRSEGCDVRTLTFGKEPTALAAGKLNIGATLSNVAQQDALLFGAATSLMAYDVDKNKQYYYKDVEDGVLDIVCGPINPCHLQSPTGGGSVAGEECNTPMLAIVGGNCSVYGFDSQGVERFWTVTGDRVSSLMMLPWSDDSAPPALVAASEDFDIRIFNGEEAIASIMEVDRIRCLVPHQRPKSLGSAPCDGDRGRNDGIGCFAYLLDNGTVGVYQRTERLWRIKGKSKPVSAVFCDVNHDGEKELVVGWANGRVDVRSNLYGNGQNKGGEVLFRETYASSISAVLAEDYRQDGHITPMICTADGTVRGISWLQPGVQDASETRVTQELESLVQEKQLLTVQLASLKEQLALKRQGEADITMPEVGADVRYECRPNWRTSQLDLILTLHSAQCDAIIHSCLLTSDVPLFLNGEESACLFADIPSAVLVCSIDYIKDVPASVHATVAVGTRGADKFHMFDVQLTIPSFVMYPVMSMWLQQSDNRLASIRSPLGCTVLSFDKPLPMNGLETWMRGTFHVPSDVSLVFEGCPKLLLQLCAVRSGTVVEIEVSNPLDALKSIIVRTDTMDVCGDIIASLDCCQDVCWDESGFPIETRCDFPADLQQLGETIQRLEDADSIRMKLTTDMADAASIIKTLLLRAEDSRLLGSATHMKKAYAALYGVDCELLADNMVRTKNYDELKNSLKVINTFVKNGARLRLGRSKTELTNACRSALLTNRRSLINLIRTGSD